MVDVLVDVKVQLYIFMREQVYNALIEDKEILKSKGKGKSTFYEMV